MRLAWSPRLFVVVLCANAARAGAQEPPVPIVRPPSSIAGTAPCEGRIVTRIETRAAPPPFSGAARRWQTLARGVGLHHAETRPRVVGAFMALYVGRPCTEFRRAESERVLRAQPFIADARVRIQPDTGDGVVAVVETVDEIPVLVGARFRGFALPDVFSLGNANIGGEGLRVEGQVERARAYRTGYGVRLASYAVFDHPYVVSLAGFRHRVGSDLIAELSHPFFTDLQRFSWHVGARRSDVYRGFVRPARDHLALRTVDVQWDASNIVRLFGTRTVALLGAAASGRRMEPGAQGILVTDSGFARDTGVALLGRYQPFEVTRVGAIAGVRRFSFVPVAGFDALTGGQDVPSGVMGAVYLARGLPSMGEGDKFASGAVYAGFAGPRIWLATLAELEGRRDDARQEWNSVVGSNRTALYLGRAPGLVLVLDDELSGGLRSRLPMQLTLGDRVGGIRGYRNSALAGARRNVARAEARWSAAALMQRADVGVATFGEVGTLWAGDTPYGWTGSRGTIGVSLLAAYPTRSKRLYRADLAFPLTRKGEGGGRIELRFSSENRTERFWDEPDDVARARTGAPPSSLFAWPSR